MWIEVFIASLMFRFIVRGLINQPNSIKILFYIHLFRILIWIKFINNNCIWIYVLKHVHSTRLTKKLT